MNNQKIDHQNIQMIKSHYQNYGLCFFRGVKSIQDFISLAEALGSIQTNSKKKPVTEIKMQEESQLEAFSNKKLSLHTDRAAYENPPKILLLLVQKKARKGGESRILNGAKVYNHIKTYNSQLLDTKVQYSSHSGIAPTTEYPVFQIKDNQVNVRIRFDQYAKFLNIKIKEELQKIMNQHSFTIDLEEGQGYVIDNQRFIHGRQEYQGDRITLRIFVQPIK